MLCLPTPTRTPSFSHSRRRPFSICRPLGRSAGRQNKEEPATKVLDPEKLATRPAHRLSPNDHRSSPLALSRLATDCLAPHARTANVGLRWRPNSALARSINNNRASETARQSRNTRGPAEPLAACATARRLRGFVYLFMRPRAAHAARPGGSKGRARYLGDAASPPWRRRAFAKRQGRAHDSAFTRRAARIEGGRRAACQRAAPYGFAPSLVTGALPLASAGPDGQVGCRPSGRSHLTSNAAKAAAKVGPPRRVKLRRGRISHWRQDMACAPPPRRPTCARTTITQRMGAAANWPIISQVRAPSSWPLAPAFRLTTRFQFCHTRQSAAGAAGREIARRQLHASSDARVIAAARIEAGKLSPDESASELSRTPPRLID